MYKTVPPAMLNRVFFFHLCNTTMKAMAMSSGRQWSREKTASFRQYTTSIPMTAQGRKQELSASEDHEAYERGADADERGPVLRRLLPLVKEHHHKKGGHGCFVADLCSFCVFRQD